MKIKYKIELEDCFIFNDYLMRTSPLIHKTIRKGQLWWSVGPLVGGLAISIVKGGSPDQTLKTLAFLSVALSLPLFLLYPHYFRHRNKKLIRKLRDNDNHDFFGLHEMEISNEYLTERTGDNESRVPWNTIQKVETAPDHTFVFTDDVTAYIIPHNKITDGNASQFVNKLTNTMP